MSSRIGWERIGNAEGSGGVGFERAFGLVKMALVVHALNRGVFMSNDLALLSCCSFLTAVAQRHVHFSELQSVLMFLPEGV
jgi:hypothetical protein